MHAVAPLDVGLEPFPGYRLSRLLGAGAFGRVWEAQTPQGQTVALKFLLCDAQRTAAREIRSLQAIRRLEHEHLIRIEQVWCYGGYVVVAMERADGSLADLHELYQEEFGTPIVPEHACLLLTQAAKALDFLNAPQHAVEGRRVAIQHCDIKPSNLLLFGDHLKVADFGLSAVLNFTQEKRSRAGTLDYCAPEIFLGRLTSSSDQYALAVTYCQVRGGRLPFMDTPRTFGSRYVRPAPDLGMVAAAERPILARALSPVPQDRWPSCCEFLARLTEAVHGPRKKAARGGETRTESWPELWHQQVTAGRAAPLR
jgi:serine/threonine protein kinase